jgi:hypothetical protein
MMPLLFFLQMFEPSFILSCFWEEQASLELCEAIALKIDFTSFQI